MWHSVCSSTLYLLLCCYSYVSIIMFSSILYIACAYALWVPAINYQWPSIINDSENWSSMALSPVFLSLFLLHDQSCLCLPPPASAKVYVFYHYCPVLPLIFVYYFCWGGYDAGCEAWLSGDWLNWSPKLEPVQTIWICLFTWGIKLPAQIKCMEHMHAWCGLMAWLLGVKLPSCRSCKIW